MKNLMAGHFSSIGLSKYQSLVYQHFSSIGSWKYQVLIVWGTDGWKMSSGEIFHALDTLDIWNAPHNPNVSIWYFERLMVKKCLAVSIFMDRILKMWILDVWHAPDNKKQFMFNFLNNFCQRLPHSYCLLYIF